MLVMTDEQWAEWIDEASNEELEALCRDFPGSMVERLADREMERRFDAHNETCMEGV